MYPEAIEMYKKTLMNIKMLLSVLSNSSLVSLYSHSPGMKLRDASFLLLLVYIGMTYCFQQNESLEETMYSILEADKVVRNLLPDSPEAISLLENYKHYLMFGVDHQSKVVFQEIRRGSRTQEDLVLYL